jgi:hypothetical protein
MCSSEPLVRCRVSTVRRDASVAFALGLPYASMPARHRLATEAEIGIVADQGVSFVTNILQDDETDTTLVATAGTYTYTFMAFYGLGEQISGNAYYRLSTSPFISAAAPPYSVPTWVTASGTPSGSTCPAGSIFSNSSGGSLSTLYVCTGTGWNNLN